MEAARQACRLAPDEWQTWHCLASAALASDLTFGVGEQAAAKARMLAPDKAEVYYVSGRVAYMFSKWKEARTFQEQALALDPAHSGALNELGRISMQRWNHARAADHFLQAAGSSPKAGVYSYNVHAAVWQPICRLMTLTMLSTYALSAAAIDHPSIAVPGLSAIALLSAVLGVARFWKFPPAARVLLHTMRVVLVLSVAYGSVVGAIIIAAAIPAPSQAGTYAILGPTGVTTMCLVYVAVYTTRLKGKLTSSP
jgi:tetratricopeptide (TPR) repeat protein